MCSKSNPKSTGHLNSNRILSENRRPPPTSILDKIRLANGVFGIDNIDVIIHATAIFTPTYLGLRFYGVDTPNFAFYNPDFLIPPKHSQHKNPI
jgi:hypothetical protein